MAAPLQIALDQIVRGDTWAGVAVIGPITDNGAPPSHPLVRVAMAFKQSYDDPAVGYLLSSDVVAGAGSIVITDADNWTIQIPAQSLPLDVGDWLFDVQYVDSVGTIITPWAGVLTILPDVTPQGG